MANPNLMNLTSVLGKTTFQILGSTSEINVLNNPASSGEVYRISFFRANGSPSSVVKYHTEDDLGGTAYEFTPLSEIGIQASVSHPIYLVEDRSIGVTAETADAITVIITYEIMSA